LIRLHADQHVTRRRGTPEMPSTCTGMPGPACLHGLPRSSSMARTRPSKWPQTNESPTRSVPFVTSTVATGPLPTSSCASTTVPCAAGRVRLQVEHLGLQQDLVQQVRHAGALLRADLRRQHLAAEVLDDDAVLQQVLLDLDGSRPAGRSC
jgi:hypothetical protein